MKKDWGLRETREVEILCSSRVMYVEIKKGECNPEGEAFMNLLSQMSLILSLLINQDSVEKVLVL